MDIEERVQIATQHLLLNGTARRGDPAVRILKDDSYHGQVRMRLSQVGLDLVESHATDSYGVRVQDNYWQSDAQDTTNNKGLGKDAFAALTIFWCKLVLPYRIQTDRQQVVGQVSFDAKKNRESIMKNPPTVQIDSVYYEFKNQLGNIGHFKSIVGQLVKQDFLQRRGKGQVTLGPNLDTALDWQQMKDFIEAELAEVKLKAEAIPVVNRGILDEVHELLLVAGEPVSAADVATSMRIDQDVCDEAIKSLRAEGRVRKVGDKKGSKYEAIGDVDREEE